MSEARPKSHRKHWEKGESGTKEKKRQDKTRTYSELFEKRKDNKARHILHTLSPLPKEEKRHTTYDVWNPPKLLVKRKGEKQKPENNLR